MKEFILGLLLYILPKRWISLLTGKLVHSRLPKAINKKAKSWFVNRYKIDMSEAEFDLDHYPHIGAVFTRRLKDGLRPIKGLFVHPADARLTAVQDINSDTLVQAKGKKYHLSKFLNTKNWQEFEGGKSLTYYLCPTDYHRVHSPITGEITSVHYIPGTLWPVNDWSVKSIKNLFAVNERVVVWYKTPKGRVAVVLVGATNVGKMSLSFDKNIVTNQSFFKPKDQLKTYEPPISIKAGDELGVFHMGSTVICVYPKDFLPEITTPLGSFTKVGVSV